MGHYERLSALDASFLEIEDENSHMHVAATLLLDAAPLLLPHGGLDVERVRAYVESRLHLMPRYRQRLAWIPLERHPVWVDDARFNLFYHVRHAALPRPGEERQLKRLCGRILSQKLDVTKPLWEIWVVEGLADNRFALIIKAHHSMVDGVSGMDLLTILLAPTPERRFEPAPPWHPRPAASMAELVGGELWRRGTAPIRLAQAAGGALARPWQAIASARDVVEGLVEAVATAREPASETPLNPSIGPHRRFDWLRLGVDDVKAVKSRWGGTLNDVVLATVAGGVRRFLIKRGVRTDGLDFRALVPVSVRSAAERGRLGNRVAQMLASLPIAERDPLRRYRAVVETTGQLKRSHVVEGTELIEEVSNWTATALLTEIMRLSVQRRVYNVIVTNVPGPAIPLYFLGAPVLAAYPMVPLFGNQAVGVALFSYAGGLFWGINADWDAMPDLHDLVWALRDEFADLQQRALSDASAA
ncbi:MAG: wax ester/triacylglycerol synthase family O-acyltransferase [Candidatus Binatia bacterium]